MWSSNPSSLLLSKSHAFDVELRTALWNLWGGLPKLNRVSWADHPDYALRGAWTCFWFENYFRWRELLGPILSWPQPEWSAGPYFESATANAKGNAVEGVLNFSNPGEIATIAIAFYHHHFKSVFGQGLKSLQIIDGSKPISYIIRELPIGWQKGIGQIFSAGGYAGSTIQFPTTFCR